MMLHPVYFMLTWLCLFIAVYFLYVLLCHHNSLYFVTKNVTFYTIKYTKCLIQPFDALFPLLLTFIYHNIIILT